MSVASCAACLQLQLLGVDLLSGRPGYAPDTTRTKERSQSDERKLQIIRNLECAALGLVGVRSRDRQRVACLFLLCFSWSPRWR